MNARASIASSAEILAALNDLRRKLLDLTGHNPLLNFNHGRSTRYIRIVDELPSQLVPTLLEGKSFRFAPVPKPDESEIEQLRLGTRQKGAPSPEEWAQSLGIQTDYEVPEATRRGATQKHSDRLIQTLHFPDVLEARLANIARLARTTIEETGVNMLHLVVGFLEWYEADDSDKPRLAPLITIPVAISKGVLQPSTRTYDYQLTYSGEDCQENVSLAARLEQDFSYNLPAFGDEVDVEGYLKKISASIRKKFPRWAVRRFITVGFFNFGKLLMYRDLDPEKWPTHRKLENNPLVESVIAGSGRIEETHRDGMNATFEEECRIDEIPDIYESYPIIDNADSSQHSALIDAVKGKNLVIEGPPGTGKSQTITNLIAAAMYSGKSVLFVSEKLAALEVVKQRLDRLGLGLYCLELHSHATQKAGVIESIKQRIEARPTGLPAAYDEQIRRHQKLCVVLGQYAERINSKWGETGLTLHEILVGAVRLREQLGDELRDVLDPEADTTAWSGQFLEDLVQKSKAYQGLVRDVIDQLGGRSIATTHPWRGVTSPDLPIQRHQQVLQALLSWNGKLSACVEIWRELGEILRSDVPSDDLVRVEGVACDVCALPEHAEGVIWEALPWASQSGISELSSLVSKWEEIQGHLDSVGAGVNASGLAAIDLCSLRSRWDSLVKAGIAKETSLAAVISVNGELESAISHSQEISRYFLEYTQNCEGPPSTEFANGSPSWQALTRIAWLLHHLRALGRSGLEFRCPRWVDPEALKRARLACARLAELQAEMEELAHAFRLDSLPESEKISAAIDVLSRAGLFRRLFSPRYRRAKAETCGYLVGGKKGFNPDAIVGQLGKLRQHLADASHFLSNLHLESDFPQGLWKGLSTDRKLLTDLIEFHAWILHACTGASGGLFSTIAPDRFGTWVLQCPAADLERVQVLDKVDFTAKTNQICALVETLRSLGGDEEAGVVSASAPLCGEDNSPESGALDLLLGAVHSASLLAATPGFSPGMTLTDAERLISSLEVAQELLESWQKAVRKANRKVAFAGALDETCAVSAADSIAATRRWAHAILELHAQSPVRAALLEVPSTATLANIRNWASRLADGLASSDAAALEFLNAAGAVLELWNEGCGTLGGLIERNTAAAASLPMLPSYLRLLSAREDLWRVGLSALADAIEGNSHEPETIGDACRHAVLHGLSNRILEEEPMLRKFDGNHQRQVQVDFRALDKQLLRLTSGKVAARVSQRTPPLGVRGARVKDHTELELLSHEINKHRSHLPIRQLLRRAGAATKALKPCFMMGPRSVAQYLDPAGITFDLLVIDEASQMKPADAIGAVARVKQLVVVGDPKQLPPTSFFDRLNSGDEEEDEFAIGTSESILDAMIPIFSARRLRWHYRSRHESLIAFSNRNFYDNHLLLFPSPGDNEGAMGVRFHRIPEGQFVDQVNRPEALAVAKRVEELLCMNPSMSIGVATMSAKQRDYLEGIIDALAKNNPDFNQARAKNAELYESLFVKNLETVQGDERAVMLISCTYGPAQVGGRVFQRFGPINSSVGWRRLNVLFTRSRDRMEIFSSMTAGDIVISEGSSRGVQALRQFLHYAETKNFEAGTVSGRPPDSDFEIAVARLLAEHGFICDFQVGAAGFFIDLAVRHPRQPGRYIMGIECDGATYHAAKSVRDRDRLRQEILESLGWSIRRIWSTDWFINPRGSLASIIEQLHILAT